MSNRFLGFLVPNSIGRAVMNPKLVCVSAVNIAEQLEGGIELEAFRHDIEKGLKKTVDPYITVSVMDGATKEIVPSEFEPDEFHLVISLESYYHSFGTH